MTERPPHLGLRHLALKVKNLDAMLAFYVDVMGFAVEWRPDDDNVYLTSGRDNLALHREAGGPGALGSESTLDHLGLVVSEPADVDRFAAFLEERGVRLDARPRTHRDGARSCYLRDPDGNRVQVIFHQPISDKL